MIDVDGNGWSDLWDAAYGTGLLPEGDEDGDGVSNLNEYVAGTNPRDLTSVPPEVTATRIKKKGMRLTWPSVAGKQYQLQISTDGQSWVNIGAPLMGTGSLLEFEVPKTTTFLTGSAAFARWSEMSSGGIDTVKNNAVNGVQPTLTGTLNELEIPPTSPDENSFGQWIAGWILPPRTGQYTFSISSDDGSQLYLSSDATAEKQQMIASVPGWTSLREWSKYPLQTSAPISLRAGVPYYFAVYHREYGGGDHVSVAWSGPGLTEKEVISGKYLATSPENFRGKFSKPGKVQYRVLAKDVDSDGDGVTDWEESILGYDPTNPMTTPRVPDREAVLASLTATNVISVGTSVPRGYEKEQQPCRFTFFRHGNINPVTIRYSISGTAQGGADYEMLSGTVFLPVGQNSVSVDVVPTSDNAMETAETLVATVLPDPSYTLGEPNEATAIMDDAQDLIFIASLKPVAGTRSIGHGTATLRVAGNKAFANFSLSYGGLTSTPGSAELFISKNGKSGGTVWAPGAGQITKEEWLFDSAAASKEAILAALLKGRLWIRIPSARFADGELAGSFILHAASKKWRKPPPAGGVQMKVRSDAEAARFLTQATFGPTEEEITRVKKLGYQGWLADQFKRPIGKHLPYVHARRLELLERSGGQQDGWQMPRQEAWWQHALAGSDQLRQRMAFALSQILVVSDVGVLDSSHEGITNYYDMLLKHAFGNFRNLLEDVTLSPIMGQYLSMARNQKPNPTTGSEPDENYAREVMQLFTIGLNQLHPDGSLKLGPDGMPIPTYTQSDIVGMAHVFTGWGFGYDPANPPSNLRSHFLWGAREEMRQMVQYPEFHDKEMKRIINGVVIPAGQTGEQDLKLALDTLFKHPNMGPFIGRQLIQRFVTSNPSPGYIYRVASAFNNNGRGVRGDLKATLTAVLLDPEARNPEYTKSASFGKLREPLLRMTHLLRALRAKPPVSGDDRFFIDLQYSMSHQSPLKSPSVFNFFQPSYIQPGRIAEAGVYSPEFQITSETSVISQINLQHSAIFWGIGTPERDANNQSTRIQLDVAPEVAILNTPTRTPEENQQALLDHLNVLLLNGQMSDGLRTKIMGFFAALPSGFGYSDSRQADRVKVAIYLIQASPEYSVQK